MYTNIFLRRALCLAGIAAIASTPLLISYENGNQTLRGLFASAPVESIRTVVRTEHIIPGLPMRLKIPAINVDAVVEHIGLTAEGAMGAPKDPDHTAWFDAGRRPGEDGSAVIDGHFGWRDGIPAAFDDLASLQKGDMLYVQDEKGATVIFVVREVKSYDQNADATAIFGSQDGKAHLNLITCEGVWSSALHSYSDRLVVFADKVVAE